MKKIVIYTTPWCPYCAAAKNLLKAKGVDFEEIRIDSDPEKRAEMRARAQRTSVPQIFVADTYLGGFDDIAALDRRGELERALRG